jgi:hypothetical protein
MKIKNVSNESKDSDKYENKITMSSNVKINRK